MAEKVPVYEKGRRTGSREAGEGLATELKTDADFEAAKERQRKAREDAAKPRGGGLAAAAERARGQAPVKPVMPKPTPKREGY